MRYKFLTVRILRAVLRDNSSPCEYRIMLNSVLIIRESWAIVVPMYIESVPNRQSPPCILLREDHREGSKVVKKTLANLTKWPTHVVEGLRVLIKGGSVAELDEDSFAIARSLPHGHVAAVLSVLKRLGLHQLIASRSSSKRDLVVAMIVARIIDPQSNLATARGFRQETLFSSLAQECRLA